MCHNANVHAPYLKLKAEKLVVFYWDVLELHVSCEGWNGTTACVNTHTIYHL